MIDAALGHQRLGVIPVLNRVQHIDTFLPLYQIRLLHHLAERDRGGVVRARLNASDILERLLLDLASAEDLDALEEVIPGFGAARALGGLRGTPVRFVPHSEVRSAINNVSTGLDSRSQCGTSPEDVRNALPFQVCRLRRAGANALDERRRWLGEAVISALVTAAHFSYAQGIVR